MHYSIKNWLLKRPGYAKALKLVEHATKVAYAPLKKCAANEQNGSSGKAKQVSMLKLQSNQAEKFARCEQLPTVTTMNH